MRRENSWVVDLVERTYINSRLSTAVERALRDAAQKLGGVTKCAPSKLGR
jgi:hypothetical protein